MNTVKKTYVKPALELVDFTLSSSIAATCRFEANSAENECLALDNGWTVYNATISACIIDVDNKEVCYHVPTDDANIFAS